MCRTHLFVLLFIFFGSSVICGQELPAGDSLFLLPDTVSIDSVYRGISHIPGDMSFIPAEIMYNRIWDNYNIRYRTEVLPPKTDTLTIPLYNPDDYCFNIPVVGKVISGFRTLKRKNHSGTDIKLAKGDSIRCAFDGKVRIAKAYGSYGLLVIVRHKNGLETFYGHLSKILVKENQFVNAGDVLGLGGRTGRATTDHLHFESRLFGMAFNSEKYIDFGAGQLKGDTLYYINGRVELNMKDFPELSTSQKLIAGYATGEAISHIIHKGDTLWSLARKYNTSVNQICLDNNITPSKVLRIGDVLLIR